MRALANRAVSVFSSSARRGAVVHAEGAADSDVLSAMQSLAINGVTAEVSAALDAAGVPSVLLKGPAIARWLYPKGGRGYGDTDLLIPEVHETGAEETLTSLGFRAAPGTGWPDPGVARNHLWTRESAVVELHVTLIGLGADHGTVWAALSKGTETMTVHRQTVRLLALPARLLHVALHAAQHGPHFGKALQDLELACAAHDLDDWCAASRLAARLDAVDALSAGLHLVPKGRLLRRQLSLPEPTDPLVLLRASSASPVAMGLARLAREAPRARATHMARILFPTPTFLRWWTPIASRGSLGLVPAYVWRYIYLVGVLPGAIKSFVAARRRLERPAAPASR